MPEVSILSAPDTVEAYDSLELRAEVEGPFSGRVRADDDTRRILKRQGPYVDVAAGETATVTVPMDGMTAGSRGTETTTRTVTVEAGGATDSVQIKVTPNDNAVKPDRDPYVDTAAGRRLQKRREAAIKRERASTPARRPDRYPGEDGPQADPGSIPGLAPGEAPDTDPTDDRQRQDRQAVEATGADTSGTTTTGADTSGTTTTGPVTTTTDTDTDTNGDGGRFSRRQKAAIAGGVAALGYVLSQGGGL